MFLSNRAQRRVGIIIIITTAFVSMTPTASTPTHRARDASKRTHYSPSPFRVRGGETNPTRRVAVSRRLVSSRNANRRVRRPIARPRIATASARRRRRLDASE